MSKPVVSVVKYQDPFVSLKEAIDLCDGLNNLRKEDKIVIKPNIVAYDFDYPVPYGAVVTSVLMEALVRLLAENGYNNLTIAEGPATDENIGQAAFAALGYGKLQERYGVKLIDLHEDKFVPTEFENSLKLNVAESILTADKIITMPVLKTHSACQVSLGIKNLKGVLNRKSRQVCHGAEPECDLDLTFNQVIDKLPVALCIIDGVYALPKGPGPSGEAFRKNLVIASRDTYACDVVGAEIMGWKVADVGHLKVYAERHNRSMELDSVEVRGESVEAHRQFLAHEGEWLPDNTGPKGFAKRGITGLAFRKFDTTLCTYCSGAYGVMLVSLMSAFNGTPFPNMEVLSGKKMTATPGFDHTLLFGKCPIAANKDNPDIKNAIKVKGCPPDIDGFIEEMSKIGIEIDMSKYDGFRAYMYKKSLQQPDLDLNDFRIE
ncbi:MAG: DUF362 domain-containing protein [Bacillota bacterium]